MITIEKKQYGNYICQAENRLDSTDGKVNLNLYVLHKFPQIQAHKYAYFQHRHIDLDIILGEAV